VTDIKSNRVEQHLIKRSHPLWKVVDENCLYSKNLYNLGMYAIRQEFIRNGKWIRYKELDKLLQQTDAYKELMSQPAQQTLSALDKVWKSFFAGIKDWKKHPQKYLGRPKLPKYKDKDGRYIWFIKNNSCRIKDGRLQFIIKRLHGVSFPVRTEGRLICVRFIPRGSCYVMEVVLEVEVPDAPTGEPTRIAGIDLGINNFATVANNIGLNPIIINGRSVKAVNQFYNKRKAHMQSDLKKRNNQHWSRALDELNMKRFNRIKTFMHTASKRIVNWCMENQIDTLVCGLNKEWKQECNIGKTTNQKFVYIPYDMFIKQLEYKCQNVGIRFILTEESYTSGTSFLDGELPCKENYDKSRRIKRGLFQSGNGLINSDVNGSLQILMKVFPDAFSYGIEGVLTPTIISVAKVA